MKIAGCLIGFEDDKTPFLALRLIENTHSKETGKEILERLCCYERATGQSVTYAMDGTELQVYIPSAKELTIYEFNDRCRKIIAYLSDSLAPQSPMISILVRKISSRFHQPQGYIPLKSPPAA